MDDIIGMGAASDTLSFVPMAAPPPRPRTVAPLDQTEPEPASPAPTSSAVPSDWWYLNYRTSKGERVTRRLTTHQVLDLIKQKDFDLTAQACRTPEGNYRSLGTFPEFSSALVGRVTKAKADRKAAQYHELYQTILKEEKTFHRMRWFRNLFRSFAGWVTFLIYLAALAIALYVLYLLLAMGLNWLVAKLSSLE